jgi:AcrR family transcriptional regulator
MNNVQQIIVVAIRSFSRDRDEKIKVIYEIFNRLVKSEGYKEVTTRRIAEEAGISVGIIYHYFPEGKPAIAAGFYEAAFGSVMDPAHVLYGSPKDLKQEINLHLENHRRNEAVFRAFDQALLENHDIFEGLKRSRTELIEARIAALLIEEELPKTTKKELVDKYLKIYGLVDALIHRHLFQAPYAESDEELTRILVDLSLRLLGKN